jgi:hypothetical protein
VNVALPAIVIFFVLLPGFILRTRLKRVERTSLDFSPFGEVVAEAVVWSVLAHCLWLALTYIVAGQTFQPLVLLKLLSGAVIVQEGAATAFAASFWRVTSYFLSLLIAAFVLPMALRAIITKYRLDRSTSRFSYIFRFHKAPWYYLLTGADFAADEAPDMILISAIVEVGKEAVLYVGVLDEFYVDSEGQLDRFVLQNVARRPLSRDKPTPCANDGAEAVIEPVRFYDVDGDSFVLRYSEAITLNIQYVRLAIRVPSQG